jgi:hypothetical protein
MHRRTLLLVMIFAVIAFVPPPALATKRGKPKPIITIVPSSVRALRTGRFNHQYRGQDAKTGKEVRVVTPKTLERLRERSQGRASHLKRALYEHYTLVGEIGGPSYAGITEEGPAFYNHIENGFGKAIPFADADRLKDLTPPESHVLISQALTAMSHGIAIDELYIVPTRHGYQVRFLDLGDFVPIPQLELRQTRERVESYFDRGK